MTTDPTPVVVHRLSEVRAPDGTLTHKMCTFCFRMVPVDELWVDEQGQKWDSCGMDENACQGDDRMTTDPTPTNEWTDARLSRLLWDAREQVDMWADSVERRSHPGAGHAPRRVRDELDAYRAHRGWSPDGFGGEGKP